jgi:hypothetical protein
MNSSERLISIMGPQCGGRAFACLELRRKNGIIILYELWSSAQDGMDPATLWPITSSAWQAARGAAQLLPSI